MGETSDILGVSLCCRVTLGFNLTSGNKDCMRRKWWEPAEQASEGRVTLPLPQEELRGGGFLPKGVPASASGRLGGGGPGS